MSHPKNMVQYTKQKMAFLNNYKGVVFSHSIDVFQALEKPDQYKIDIDRTSLDTNHFLNIFEIRAKNVKSNNNQLYSDIMEFCNVLKEYPKQPVTIWQFYYNNKLLFGLYELHKIHRIAGCLKF